MNEREVEEILIGIAEPGKSKLRKYFNEVRYVISFNDERNRRFLDQAILLAKNIVIVVGNYHVSGMRKELETRCKGK